MAHIEQFLAPVRQQSRDDFVAANPHAFLLIAHEKLTGEPEWSFKTQTISGRGYLQRLSEEGFVLAPEVSRYEVIPVVKTQTNPWRDRVSLGRARNNDIVLLDSSVSKLHAHFILEDGGKVGITDAGSRNGTKVNKKKVGDDKVTPLASGDQLVIGRIEVTFLNSEGLHDFVTKHIQKREAP